MEYIYTTNSLSGVTCKKIITYYDKIASLKYQGVTFKGLDKRVKDTTDIIIPYKNNIYSEWDEINDILSTELYDKLKKYICHLNNKKNYNEENNYGRKFNHLDEELFLINNFMIQRYEQNEGKYVYHHDGAIDLTQNKHRVITYLWYLNDVTEGGETEFFGGNLKITPEEGKLLFFPANWAFPHRGNKPRSSHKYIITGWLYCDNGSNNNKILNIPYIIEPTKIIIDSNSEINKDFLENNIIQYNDNKNDINNECKKDYELTTTNNKKISVTKKVTSMIFDFFYNSYPYIFNDYKNYINTGKTFMEDIDIDVIYSNINCIWIINQINQNLTEELWNKNLDNKSKFVELNVCTSIVPYIISSFQIISDLVKFKYTIDKNINFNIKKWFIYECVSENDFIEDLKIYKSDLVFEAILLDTNNETNGKVFVSKKIKYYPNMKYILVFFVDFSFIYCDKDNSIINLSLSELVDNADLLEKIII
jgi:hypothetical protein